MRGGSAGIAVSSLHTGGANSAVLHIFDPAGPFLSIYQSINPIQKPIYNYILSYSVVRLMRFFQQRYLLLAMLSMVLRRVRTINNRQVKSFYQSAQDALGSPLRSLSAIDASKLLTEDAWALLAKGINPLESAKVSEIYRHREKGVCGLTCNCPSPYLPSPN